MLWAPTIATAQPPSAPPFVVLRRLSCEREASKDAPEESRALHSAQLKTSFEALRLRQRRLRMGKVEETPQFYMYAYATRADFGARPPVSALGERDFLPSGAEDQG
jgi:hypothetical protein